MTDFIERANEQLDESPEEQIAAFRERWEAAEPPVNNDD